eukprot:780477_1
MGKHIPPIPLPNQMRLDPGVWPQNFLGPYNPTFAKAGKLSKAEFNMEMKEINTVYRGKSDCRRYSLNCLWVLSIIILFIGGIVGMFIDSDDGSAIMGCGFMFLMVPLCFSWCSKQKGLHAVERHLRDCNRKYANRGLNFHVDHGYLWIQMPLLAQNQYKIILVPQKMHMQQPVAPNMYMQQPVAPNMPPPAYQDGPSGPLGVGLEGETPQTKQ